jgi:processive 1,2-diacylglycerol beta-glucosyltransferase
MKKVLILTAGFGDGHNTAAHNISKALQEDLEVAVTVIDIYLQSTPRLTKVLQEGYRIAINRFPMIWGVIFNFLNQPSTLEKTLFMMVPLKRALQKSIDQLQPDIIVSTYPLYAFLIRELRNEGAPASAVPFITMITDSTAINVAWYRAGSDAFIVVDKETAAVLSPDVPKEKIHILGFPVAPRLAALPPLPIMTQPPWKILYLPSSKAQHTLKVLEALRHIPHVQITVVTGRLREMHTSLEKSGIFDGVQLKLIGWTDTIPELLTSHHLYIGKAGGAIVHEAMAAKCPLLISHIVPGQEEGNIELIERHDIGRLAAHYPETIAASVEEVFSQEAETWRRWKEHLKALATSSSTQKIAKFILNKINR